MATKTKRSAKKSPKKRANEGELVIRRIFDAPRELVWKAWTQPERFKRWWGPKGYTIPSCDIDLRVGGKYLYCMRSPEGKDFWATGVYRQIVPMEKFVTTDSFADEHGNVVDATHYGMTTEMPLEMVVTVTFEDVKGGTKLTLRHAGIPAGPDREGAGQGWSESFDKLAEELAVNYSATEFVLDKRKRRLVMSRVFAAPRDRLWRVYTDPKLVPQWWGPRYLKTTVERMEVRRGGRWRYVQQDPDGNVFAFRGEYREVVPPERLVSTFELEGAPGNIMVDTATFEDLGGRTRLTVTSIFEGSDEALEEMIKSGMESGARETWDRLAELLARTPSKRGA